MYNKSTVKPQLMEAVEPDALQRLGFDDDVSASAVTSIVVGLYS